MFNCLVVTFSHTQWRLLIPQDLNVCYICLKHETWPGLSSWQDLNSKTSISLASRKLWRHQDVLGTSSPGFSHHAWPLLWSRQRRVEWGSHCPCWSVTRTFWPLSCSGSQVEFEWLRQFWFQGNRNKLCSDWWCEPMTQLEELWKKMESVVSAWGLTTFSGLIVLGKCVCY